MTETADLSRRHFLTVATAITGGVGIVAAAVPFVSSFEPSARAQALGAPVQADISKLELGSMMKLVWRGKPIYIVNRTKAMLATLSKDHDLLRDPNSDNSDQPSYAKNEYRSRRPEFLVMIGVCTHLGCAPLGRFQIGAASGLGSDWPSGFYCPCHGSLYDISGRVFKDVPAPKNMAIPPYRFVNDTTIMVGSDAENS